ncbi:hypothetical protein RF55_26543, partial [Lasius niger]
MQAMLLQQVHLGIGASGYEPVTHGKVDTARCAEEERALESRLLCLCPAHVWPQASYRCACPRPILVGRHHQQQVQQLHDALTAAITDMVQRWWTDGKARFPERMPLERREEELLR